MSTTSLSVSYQLLSSSYSLAVSHNKAHAAAEAPAQFHLPMNEEVEEEEEEEEEGGWGDLHKR